VYRLRRTAAIRLLCATPLLVLLIAIAALICL